MAALRGRVSSALVFQFAFVVTLGADLRIAASADEQGESRALPQKGRGPDRTLLTPDQWNRLDRAVDRGLTYLSREQEPDGSFPTNILGQPGVTSLCVMAFLSRGHRPGNGPYGSQITKAIDYVLAMQDSQVGSLMSDQWVGPEHSTLSRIVDGRPRSFTGNYNHGIAGVMLAEVYGMTDGKRNERIREAVLKALEFTRKQQLRPKHNPAERGGWRYLHFDPPYDSDLSVTAWQLMFLRSARNAEFNVPEEWVQEAMGYVHRSFDVKQKGFVYSLSGGGRYCSRAMVGAGIVCLALGGEHQSQTAKMAGDWILRSSFEPYNRSLGRHDRYHYGAFYCSQAMFQLGDGHWRTFFPKLLNTLADAQHSDGSWDVDRTDAEFGNHYTTALTILALATPYQILPIYQR